MKVLNVAIISILLIVGCTDKLAKERIQFSEKLLANWDSVNYIISHSQYNCNKKIEYSSSIKDIIINNKYVYYYDDYVVSYSESGKPIDNTYKLNKNIGHFIVFIDFEDNKFITFDYSFQNGKWCYEYTFLGNALEYSRVTADEL